MPFPTYNTHSLATIIPTAISTSTISTALSTYTQRIECRGFGISTIVYYYILPVAISCYIFRCDAIELYYSSRANYIAPSSPIYPTPKHTLMRTNCLVSPLSTTFQLVSYHMLYAPYSSHHTSHGPHYTLLSAIYNFSRRSI